MAESNNDYLFKFCSAESAKQILATRALRWSAPGLLNDPLELNHTSCLNFSMDALLRGAIKSASGMIFSRDAPRGSAPLMVAIRRWRVEGRFSSPEEAEDVLKELLSQMVDQRQQAIEQIMSDWQDFTRRLRICSFCAKAENPVAWQAFGHDHSGVTLRFHLQEGKSFGQPQAVKYTDLRPAITTLKEQLGVILTGERHVAQDRFLEKFTTKANEFRCQQELRCFYQLTEEDGDPGDDVGQWFIDRHFEPDSLKSVYFGIATSGEDKREIWDLVKEHFTLVKLFETKLVHGKFELESRRLTEKPLDR